MMNKLKIWGAIILIISAIVLPLTYTLFSMWWLFTGDMVTRLTFFITNVISTSLIVIGLLLTNFTKKVRYRDGKNQIQIIKEMFNV